MSASEKSVLSGPSFRLSRRSPPDVALGAPQPELFKLGLVLALIGLLTVVRLVLIAATPLSFDEALYWRYSKNLAAGYIDHPFLNPLAIRIGTSVFGDTPFGVRIVSVASSLGASWAVWRAALALFDDRAIATTALLLVNLTVTFTVGAMVATSDQMVVATSCLLLLCLAKLQQTGDGRWWLAVGAAFGLGLCAKYTTVFFGVGIFGWVVMAPKRRHWLFSGWSWGAAALALAIFSPVLIWNAQHQWASFVYQAGRMTIFKPTVRFVFEFVGSLTILVTPGIFVLGVVGAFRLAKGEAQGRGAVLVTLTAPLLVYLLWHSTHQRVQGNWSEPVVPALALMAAYAIHRPPGEGVSVKALRLTVQWACPLALSISAVLYLAVAGLTPPLGKHDLRARALGVGWTPLASQIEALRRRTGAGLILTTDYTLASWTRFYLPSPVPIVQVDERIRWSNEASPSAAALHGTALYICKEPCSKLRKVTNRYRSILLQAILLRRAGDRVVDQYRIYRADSPERAVLDPADHLPLADHAE